ncbi:MAG: EAL domain-containing protein, partial [Thermoanaerobaculia bacterium]|nr:EAL domain-containing protein [Thermoanaerobaculia bacterium]
MSEHPITVLMVEDNPSDAQVLRRLLRDAPDAEFEFALAQRVDKALERLEAGPAPDVILLDLSLPDSDPESLDAFERISTAVPGVPIIVMTGMRDQELATRAVRRGAQDFLIKGEVGADLLTRAIRYAIERQRAEETLRESEERFALAVRGANDGIWDWDLRTDRIYYSPRWKAILGFGESDLSDRTEEWLGRVHPDDRHRVEADLESHLAPVESAPTSPRHFESEHRIRHRDGGYRWVLARGIAVRDDSGEAYRVAGSMTDVTLRKNAEERLLHDALHDALTGLPNRALFLDRLGVALARQRRRQEEAGDATAVLFLDLDRFKHVNDSLGHLAGDRLLVAMSRRLQTILRPGDTVARLGGDEFAVLVDLAKAGDASILADRIHRELAVPFHIDGHEILVTVSIGIAEVSGEYERPEDLLRDSDIAMYQAKRQGRAASKTFDKTMHTRAAAMLQLESDLSRALARRELRLHYQPMISLEDDRVVGFEALLRWEHPERGLIYPGEIISVAEDTGLIVPIGVWVLEEACRQMAGWRSTYENAADLSMSINLSSKQLMQPDIVESILDILDDAGLDPHCLRLELTESVLMDNAESAVTKLTELRRSGVQIHVDDFGTGYSSLSYLQRLPVDTLKIDRTFISQITHQAESVEIVSAIITLARNLGMSVAAEGVETAEQAAGLKAMQCEYGQGFYYYRP